MDLDFVSVHKNAKTELGQYPAILTSRLVNNIYIYIYIGAIGNEENQQNIDVFTMANVQNYILAQREENTDKKTEYELNVWMRFFLI